MQKSYGVQSQVDRLESVIVRRPDQAFGNADPVKWNYLDKPDLARACQEHDEFVKIIHQEVGAEVIYHDIPLPEYADSIFVHDPVLIVDSGAVLLQMGKELRQGEVLAIEQFLDRLEIPIHYRLHGEARAEGGDCVWLDSKTLLVGQGFRTNVEGIRQLREALQDVEILPFHLPYDQGENACLHLGSFMSMLDHNLAVAYLPFVPVPLYQILKIRGVSIVEVPSEEYNRMGPNILALSPRKCLMLEGCPITKSRLEEIGCQVLTYHGVEISQKTEGGPTCLTRPILRQH